MKDPEKRNCDFCHHRGKGLILFHGFQTCPRCFRTLGLKALEGKEPPKDPFLAENVHPDGAPFVEALNLFSTKFPKSMASELLGICLVNLEQEDMSDTFLISMILAARSLQRFGHEGQWDGKHGTKVTYAFHILGNFVGISVISGGVKEGAGLSDEGSILKMVDQHLEVVFEEIKENDDGTLGPYLDKLVGVILK